MIFGVLGIIVYEIFYWIVVKFCGYKILEVKFFVFFIDGSLGYINYVYKCSFINYIILFMILLVFLFIGFGFYYLIIKMYYLELIVWFDIDFGLNFGF